MLPDLVAAAVAFVVVSVIVGFVEFIWTYREIRDERKA